MIEKIEIDDKYGVNIHDHGAKVYLTRHGVQWHEPVAQKPWISAAYQIQKQKDLLRKAVEVIERYSPKDKWEECRSDGNIFNTIEGDPIWCYDDDDCGGFCRKFLEENKEQLEALK